MSILNLLASFVLLCFIILAFLGIFFSSLYYITRVNKVKRSRRRKGDLFEPNDLVGLYGQFERLMVVQLNMSRRILHLDGSRYKRLSPARLKVKPTKLYVSGILKKPQRTAYLGLVLIIIFLQSYCMVTASFQESTLFIIGWVSLVVWVIISTWMTDLSTMNKIILSIFSPIAYFLLYIRLFVLLLFSATNTKTYV